MNKVLFVLFFIFSFSFVHSSDLTEEELAREKILNQYGSKEQFSEAIQMQDEEKRQIELIERVKNTGNFLSEDEQKELSPKERKALTLKRKMELKYLFKNKLAQAQSKNEQSDSNAENLDNDNSEEEPIVKHFDPNKMSKNFFTNMMNDRMKVAAMQMMEENPFSKISKEELRQSIIEKIQNSKASNFILSKPKLIDAIVEVAHDEKTIPKLLGIINKPDVIKKYGIIVLAVTICAFILNLLNSKKSILKRILLKLCIMLVASTINFAAFYFLFREELKPTIDAIFRVL